ncbi:MAG TPA: DUF805 domain-containing protein [Acidimicrobiia bacterium]|jgi:uncharacterized membrane protein YhaH (DUF805 family)|nr:DUF805 domain-containing protein [Acidimicrobiia bacterium]HIL45491.1 DUF805 domain-containing protein [Acidimicrobiia bacterium]
MKWLKGPFSKYAEFSGRASRQEYWMWILSYLVVYLVLAILSAIEPLLGVPLFLFILASLIPSLAVFVRRLHDTNRSGWWWLISFVPMIGGIVLLVFLASDSTTGDNDYGPAPQ